MNANCPRCGGGFHCGAKDDHCPCFDMNLGEALRAQLKRDYGGMECLCIACLSELKEAATSSAACSDANQDAK